MENEKLNKEGKATIELMVADGIITKECAEKYFPELKESEDEKIRQELYDSIRICNSKKVADKYIAYIEKQRKQKPAWNDDDETRLKAIILNLEELQKHFAVPSTQYISKCIVWLEAIKNRVQSHSNWKPTDEQIDALRYVAKHYTPTVYDKLAWDALNTTQLMLEKLEKL